MHRFFPTVASIALSIVLGVPMPAHAQPTTLWQQLWRRTDSEVQMARPCSRGDLTHVAARGRYLALSQPAAHSVTLYDIGGNVFAPLATVGTKGANASQFDLPSGVAIDAARQLLFVSDTNNHRIQIFRLPDEGAAPALTFAKSIGRPGAALGELDRPGALAVDSKGNLFVVDVGNLRVQMFSPDMQPQRAFGGNGELRNPLGIAVAPADDAVYVADAGLRRVQAFAADGSFRFALGTGRAGADAPGTSGALFYPADVAVSSDGTVLVTDCGDHIVQRFDPGGAVVWPWGHFGPDDGALNQPRAIAIDERDRVFILDFSGRRMQVFTPAGVFARSFRLVLRSPKL